MAPDQVELADELMGGQTLDAAGDHVVQCRADPSDAMFISSRVCGVCGGVHSVASSLAIEMAFGIAPPPMGLALRNIPLALDFMLDNPLHLYLLAGPDFSQLVVERTTPSLWERAQKTEARHAEVHGYRTIDYGKRGVFIREDLTEFFYEADPRYKQVGERPKNFVDTGIWDDPFAYDATYQNAAQWGERRWATPGVVIDGKLVTANLHHINMGIEEFVEHSYCEGWENEGIRHRTDPSGNPISPHHPWNKETKPKPTEKRSWKERYTWDTALRWDRQVVEAGTYAQMWTTAAAQKLPHTRFMQSTGTGLKLDVPRTLLRAMELEWKIPAVWNAFERNRNRAYHVLYSMLVAYENLLIAFDLVKQGQTKTATPYTVPRDNRVVYAGQALDRMSTEEAEELLALYDSFERMLEEASPRPPQPGQALLDRAGAPPGRQRRRVAGRPAPAGAPAGAGDRPAGMYHAGRHRRTVIRVAVRCRQPNGRGASGCSSPPCPPPTRSA